MTAVSQFPQTLVPGAEAAVAAAYLVPVAGPPRPAVELEGRRGAQGLTLGRHETCDLHLPAEQVSRKHARFRYRPPGSGSFSGEEGGWFVTDVGSRWGTFVNGRRLSENEEMPLKLGDQIRITPWTFLLANTPMPRGLRIEAEAEAATLVRNVRVADAAPLQQERLHLLLSSAGALQEAKDEKELAARLLRLAQDGTNLANGAVLKPLDIGGRFEVLASTASDSSGGSSGGGFTFSRSLLDAARSGEVAEVRADDSIAPTSQSIVQMQITRALCVPIALGETPHLFLYLDQRGETVLQQHATDQEAAVAFCIALSKIASLALTNLNGREMAKRTAGYEADIKAAERVQKELMPEREGSRGGFTIVGESRAGRGVGGDFWDVIELGRDKVAVAVGDVSGKGIAASVLMTETHGFLHALLRDARDLEDVAKRLNAHIHPRRSSNRFITLWLGIFDKSTARLTYVDAGHGLGILADSKGECHELSGGGGMPIGVMADSEYAAVTVPLGAGDSVLIVSDGIVEQPSAAGGHDDRDEFGTSRTKQVLCQALAKPDPVAKIFEAVVEHAGTKHLADDATAVLVRG